MVSILNRKLLRDLWRMRGQVLAIALVTMCGVATFVTLRGAYEAMLTSQQNFYTAYHFADVFVNLKRAPQALLTRVQEIPGVNKIDDRVVFEASLDVPGLAEPATGRMISIGRTPGWGLNRIHLRAGRFVEPGQRTEVLISESFSQANKLNPGDTLLAIINGRREVLTVVGIAISPEFINEVKSGGMFPDHRRFGVLWMERESLASAVGLSGAFNNLTLTLVPNSSVQEVINQLDRLLKPYGGTGAYSRDEQVSHQFLEAELAQDYVTATIIPAIFLAISAYLIHNVLMRLSVLQRQQIALLKSFGYYNVVIAWHYFKFALLIISVGGVLGVILGIVLGHGLSELYMRFFHFPELRFAVSPFNIGFALLISVFSASLGAWLAVRKIVVMPPAEAMRPEVPKAFYVGRLDRQFAHLLPIAARMVWRHLSRQPIKAALSTIGIASALSLLIVGQYSFDALDEIIRVNFRLAQRDDASVVFNEPRSINIAHELAAIPGVLRVEPFRVLSSRLHYQHRSKRIVVMGLYPQHKLRFILDEKERPIELPEQGIVLTRKLADILSIKIGQVISIESLESRRLVRQTPVAGITDELVGITAYMNAQFLAKLMGESEVVSGAFLALDKLDEQAVYQRFKAIPAIASVNIREAMLHSFTETVAENLQISTWVLIVFACIIAMGIVYNGARIALSEHAIELASLRILGFTKHEISGMLLSEQVLLTMCALPLGFVLGFALCALIASAFSAELYRLPLIVSAKTFLISGVAVIVAAVVSAFLVWRQIQSLDLIAVLKARE